eukprot:CAMPEP_0170177722 /NCGR_PEP_ID=MMETSP0040_2-20121228/10901_1 /TAXON_ID=641309 /ORGANISM="Lotharella oceanica, Strain CCMP622" /LENGTH=286 /DNA_ID=CAMNT_0010420481 /DNA_START=8 /DNA_END=868 /DNA_ORIENTATION=+
MVLSIGTPPSCSPSSGYFEVIKPAHSRMNKIYECQFWSQGRCRKADCCTYVHAFINPEKKGVCQRHLEGNCPFDEHKCHYMHLPLPLVAYEKLATAATDYPSLDRLVGKYLERKAAKDAESQQDPSETETEAQCESKEKIDSEKIDDVEFSSSSRKMLPKAFASQSCGLLDSAPFKSPFRALPRFNSQIMDHKYEDQAVAKPQSTKTNQAWSTKSMSTWTPEEVGCFIKSLGTSPCWEKHAKTFVEEQVDGATLFAYKDMTAILEDFKCIKRPHARSMSTAISRLA